MAPAGNEEMLQVRTPPPMAKVPRLGVTLAPLKVKLEGRSSVTTTSVAVAAPLLKAVIW